MRRTGYDVMIGLAILLGYPALVCDDLSICVG